VSRFQTPIHLASLFPRIPSPRSLLTLKIHDLQPEIIIIGGGVAGCALAYSLSHAGRKCLMIERDLSEPDRIVGELLQPGGVRALEQLGMADALEGIDATPVEGYCVIAGERQVPIPYPDLEGVVDGCATNGYVNGHANGNGHPIANGNGKANGHANGNGYANGHANGNGKANGHANGHASESWAVQCASGRKEGRSFHHGRFIQALRSKVLKDAPNATVLEATVRDLVFCPHTNQVIGVSAAPKAAAGETSEPRNIYAPLTIIADGCFSKFRGAQGTRMPTPTLRSHFVGVVIKDVDLPIKYHGTVCLTPEGPVLLYQIGDSKREIRMLVDVKGKLPSVADGSLKVRQENTSCVNSSATLSKSSSRTSPRACTLRSAPRWTTSACGPCTTRSSRPRCRVSPTRSAARSWSAMRGTCATRSLAAA